MKKQIICYVLLLGMLTGQTAAAEVRYSYDESSVRISVEADGNIGASDRTAFLVFPGHSSEPEQMIYFDFANEIGDGAQFSYDFDGNDYGAYTISLTYSDYKRNIKTIENVFYYNSPQDIAECVEIFRNVKSDAEFREAFELYGNQKHIINIEEIKEPVTDAVIKRFMMLRDIYLKNSDGLSFESCADVLKCIKGAVLVNALEENANNASELFSRYAEALGTMYEKDADIDGVRILMNKISSKIKDGASLRTAVRYASIFSVAVDGTESDFAEIINKHSSEIGADLSYASRKKVTVAQAVKYMDFMSDPAGYMYDFGKKFEAAVDSAASANKDTGNNKVGGGGGGVGHSMVIPSGTPSNADTNSGDTLSAAENTPVFNDIADVPWAQKYITEGYYNGVLSGMGEGRFAPHDNVTREQFIKMLVDALKLSVVVGVDAEFDDVDENSWYAPYIRSAYSLDITKGISEREFGTGRFITRQEMVALLYRAHWLDDGNVAFADEQSIAEYAKTAVGAYAKAGIVSGYEDNTFRPESFASRAEAAVIIGRLTDYIKESN